MADEVQLITGTWQSALSGSTNFFNVVGLVIMVGSFLLVIGIFVWLFFIYNIRFRVREVANGRVVINDSRARDFTSKDGTPHIKIFKYRDLAPVPPADAIDLTKKGKRVLEAYKFSTGEYFYITDNVNVREVPREILLIKEDEQRDFALRQWLIKNKIEVGFKPFSTNQRSTIVNQVIKAEQRKITSWKDQLPTIVSVGGMLIVLILLILNWQEIAKPFLDSRSMEKAMVETQHETIELLKELKSDVQSIKQEKGIPP